MNCSEGEYRLPIQIILCTVRSDAAYKYISLSLDITKKGGFRKEHASSLKTLGGVLLAMHRYEESYRVDSEAEALADSLMGEEVRNRTLFLEKQFETEKKEARIQLQQAQIKQKNILNYILIGGAAALAMILLLSYRNYKHRHLQQARIDELETSNSLLPKPYSRRTGAAPCQRPA